MSGRDTDDDLVTELVCPEGQGGERLDVWLSERLGLSRTRIQALLLAGKVLLDGAGPRKSVIVEPGAVIRVSIPEPVAMEAVPEDLPLDIVYEDAALLVVDKPPGMVVHPAPGHPRGTLVNALLHHVDDLSGIGGVLRPGIVHRLDRDTSGLMVVAKSDAAHRALSDALRRRRVRRRYLAVTWGHLASPTLEVDAAVGRDSRHRRRMAVREDGRRARTRARVLERWVAAELLDVALHTGRTHQIRVHLAHVGHPVVGDATYGPAWEKGMGGTGHAWARELAARVPRQFLHAARLQFEHPVTGEVVLFRSPLPPDLEPVAAWARATSGGG
ncbi:MAG TPA: RluA family pseudouridine synthase [Longimicrobiales bacterium]